MWIHAGLPLCGGWGAETRRQQAPESDPGWVEGTWSQWENPYHFNNHLLPQEPPQGGLELVGRRELVISPLTLQ